jgi:oligopeptide/dipeptide ABC transporter ATP-binding protein
MEELIRIEGLKKYYAFSRGTLGTKKYQVKAVDGITLSVNRGEVFGIVGESGCGKSTLARLLIRLEEPTENHILYEGRDIFRMPGTELKHLRRKMAMVFQDPALSLNPRFTIGQALIRQLKVNGINGREETGSRLRKVMEDIGLDETYLARYPHQLSGGEQQRASIARAILLNPEFLILDEPTSALDVSIQAQILNLLLDIRQTYNLTYFFITHNLHVVQYISDRIGVMYLGSIVEVGPAKEVYERPLHPYTYGLICAAPILSPRLRSKEKFILPGEPPSAIHVPTGCRLHPRCPFKTGRCEKEPPELREIAPGHMAACHYAPIAEMRPQ